MKQEPSTTPDYKYKNIYDVNIDEDRYEIMGMIGIVIMRKIPYVYRTQSTEYVRCVDYIGTPNSTSISFTYNKDYYWIFFENGLPVLMSKHTNKDAQKNIHCVGDCAFCAECGHCDNYEG